jgi:hypothetical protein
MLGEAGGTRADGNTREHQWSFRRGPTDLPVTGADLTMALIGEVATLAVGEWLRRRAD